MQKYLKLLFIFIIIISVYIIYNINNKNNTNYLPLGDGYARGINSYGADTYGYSDFLRDSLKRRGLLSLYTREYTTKDKTIKDIYNDILVDKEVSINNQIYNIKTLLREADIVTISIGLNDIIFEYSIRNKYIDEYEEDRIVEKVYRDFYNLMRVINKYNHKKKYIIGYYMNGGKYNNLIKKLNKKYQEYAENSNEIFISTDFVEKDKSYFDNPESFYPNTEAYHKIASKIFDKIVKK